LAVNIGPRIGIDGESEYRKQLNSIINQAKLLDSEMKKVTSAFDENENAQENLTQQTEVLQKQMDNQRKKIELLTEYQEKATQKMREAAKAVEATRQEYGENSIELQRAQREYEQTENAVRQTTIQINKSETAYNKLAKEMKDTQAQADRLDGDLDDVADSLQEGESAAFDFGDALKAGLLSEAITSGIGALKDGVKSLVEDTKEYRTIMGSLEASSQKAGYSAEETSEIYKNLYGVLADPQTAATTTANLQAIGLEQEQLTEVANAAIGAWATYGDSIPIDSLSEAINETIQAGVVTGTFADVLNWAGTNEDEFNTKLEDAADSSERASIVLDELSRQGLPELGEAWRNSNKDLVEANENTADFEETSAELAEKIAPVSNAVQKGFNGILEAAVDMLDGIDTDNLVDGIEDIFDVVEDLVKFVIQNGDTIISILTGIGSAVAAWKIGSKLKDITTKAKESTGILGKFNSKLGAASIGAGLFVGALEWLIASEKALVTETEIAQEALDKRAESLDTLKESYNDVAAAADVSAANQVAELDYIEKLYQELDTLAGANGRVAEADRERAEFIIGQLNEALGTELSLTGDQIQNYDELEGNIYDVIEAKKAEILLSASEEKYREAIQGRTEAETLNAQNYIALMQQKERVDKQYTDFARYYYDEQGNIIRTATTEGERRKLEEYQADKKLLEEMQLEYDESNAHLQQYYSDIESYESASIAITEGNTAKALEILNNQTNGIITANELMGQSELEATQTLGQQYAERLANMQSYYENYKNGVAGYTEEGLRQIAADTEKARIAFENGGGQMIDGVLTGIDGKEIDLKTTIETLTGKDVPKWARDALGDEPYNIGEEMMDDMEDGIDDFAWKVARAAVSAATGAVNATKRTLNSHSSSRAYPNGDQNNLSLQSADTSTKYNKSSKENYAFTPLPLSVLNFEPSMVTSMGQAMNRVEHSLRGSIDEISTSITPFSLPASEMNRISNISYSYGDVNIQVVASPGMDEQALADAVMNRMQVLYNRRGAAI
jgi:hypothetical protein